MRTPSNSTALELGLDVWPQRQCWMPYRPMKVRRVSWVPGSPIDYAARRPRLRPVCTIFPVAVAAVTFCIPHFGFARKHGNVFPLPQYLDSSILSDLRVISHWHRNQFFGGAGGRIIMDGNTPKHTLRQWLNNILILSLRAVTFRPRYPVNFLRSSYPSYRPPAPSRQVAPASAVLVPYRYLCAHFVR